MYIKALIWREKGIMDNRDKYYWYWLSAIPGIGMKKIKRLIEYFETPYNIYNAQEAEYRQTGILSSSDIANIIRSKNDSRMYEEYFSFTKRGIGVVTLADEEYPKRLRQLYDAPVCLYYKGSLPSDKTPSVAIVGSRSASTYGRSIAHKMAGELAQAGVSVISGMAAGIDACGHAGAIAGGGRTYAVLGCGVEVCYPAVNKSLYEEIIKNGGVLSEYPPETKPHPGQFPVRNRIISALSDAVIVVEARKKSGSLITVDQALEQNKEVLAVPGRITDKTSEGCNHLIQMGAALITETKDILDILGVNSYGKECKNCENGENKQNNKYKFCLASDEEMVYSVLSLMPKGLEQIIDEAGLAPQHTIEVMMRLVSKGIAKESARNYYMIS